MKQVGGGYRFICGLQRRTPVNGFRLLERGLGAALVVLAVVLGLPSTALAQCVTPTDCDGDGTLNGTDSCPASLAGESPDASLRHGFRDVACYRRLLPTDCEPVAVRPYDDTVPATLGGAPPLHRYGFTWVGVLPSTGVTASTPRFQQLLDDMATPAAVAASFRDPAPNAQPLPNALFSCMGSFDLLPTGQFSPLKTVFGYTAASSYVRAIVDAAHAADKLGYPKSNPKLFSDGLGLITGICPSATPSGACIVRGLVGTNGTWEQTSAELGEDPDSILFPADEDLPESVSKIFEAKCIEEYLDALRDKLLDAQTKIASVKPNPKPDPKGPATWDAVRTPFGLPPIQFLGAQFSPSSGSKPLADKFGEFTHTSAIVSDYFADWVSIQKDCSVTTKVPNFVFQRSVFTTTKDPFNNQLDGYAEYFQTKDEPRALVPAVSEFFYTYPHALKLDFDEQLAWSMLLPRPNLPPPFRWARADAALMVSQPSAGAPYLVVEKDSSLWGILDRLKWQEHVFAAPWIKNTGGQRTGGIYDFGKQLASQHFNYTKGKWINEIKQYAGQPDYAEVTAPIAWFATDGSGVGQARVTVHAAADKWHPAGNDWITNAQTKRCANLSQKLAGFPLNPNYSLDESWCSDPALPGIKELKNFEERVNSCDEDHYDPGVGDKHWLPLRDRTPFAALWGHLNGAGARAKFPSSDLLKAGVTRTNVLHEGLDINWVFHKAHMERTDVIGKFPERVCYSQLSVGTEVQIALSCSDPAFAVCGSLANNDCCNPLERYWEQYKNEIKNACSCSSPSCKWYQVGCRLEQFGSWVACGFKELAVCAPTVFAGAVEFVAKTVVAYASAACVLFTGKPDCSSAAFSVCSGPSSAAGEIENELEYNIAFGARVNKTGWGPGFDYPSNCAPSDLPSACEWGPTILSTPTVIDLKADTYLPHNAVYAPQGALLVGLDDNARLIGSKSKPDQIDPLTWTEPFTVGPGMFHETRATWGSAARQAGTGNSVDSVALLTQEMRAFGQKTLGAGSDYSFRFEMLGDLIVDCGHFPFRSEIHPPVAMALHLAGTARTRYSLFGWHRKTLDRDSVVIDLWPAVPRPSASAKLQSSVVFDAGFGAGPGSWSCTPHPSDVPNRLRCTLVAGNANGGSGCSDNPRMRPACATDVAGGLVEVFWQ